VKKLFESGSENDRLIKKVKALMVELKTLKNSYKLSSKTPLTPKLSNDSRWNSEHDMLESLSHLLRFFQQAISPMQL
jgi:hypothetical protein